MEERLLRFIAHLRLAGVRVSLAESQDAGQALTELTPLRLAWVRAALRTTLIKTVADEAIFDRLFPLYFKAETPPAPTPSRLTAEQQRLLAEALEKSDEPTRRTLQTLLTGHLPTPEELDQQARATEETPMWGPRTRSRLMSDMLRRLGLKNAQTALDRLTRHLEMLGMSADGITTIHHLFRARQQVLQEQAGFFMEAEVQRMGTRMTNQSRLMYRPFTDLTPAEARLLKQEVRRLGARLRARAALRRKKGRGRLLDVRTTLRANLYTGGAPFQLRFKKRQRKSKFVLICDVSASMRAAVEFMLYLTYEVQGQVARVRSFAFNDHLHEVSDLFTGQRPQQASADVLRRVKPGYRATDLGQSLADFCEEHLDAVDGQTTLIMLGDARNNNRDPRLDLFEQLTRRARRTVWFNPEPRRRWQESDSDMLKYKTLCTATHQVSTLAELGRAVDKLLQLT